MNKYFEVKPDCELYREYFAHEKAKLKIALAFREVREKFGIESKEFFPYKDRLCIVPTVSDKGNFLNIMNKTHYGEFRRNSKVSKMWVELVKNIEHFERPELLYYFPSLIGHRWKERLFHVGEKLYCSIESDGGEISTPDFVVEMKASEFYKIIEDAESDGR